MGVHRLTLTGGEPLLHPDLFEIVKYARKIPMTVTIFTNGTLITEEHVDKFKKLGVKVVISVDSFNEQTHDTFRGKKGALKKTLQGITLLRAGGLPVSISVSVSQLNKHELVDTLKYFREHNLTDYQVTEVNISGRGIDEVVITPEEYYQVLVEKLTYEKEIKKFRGLVPKGEEGCGIAQSLIYIKADGTILPCHACHKEMGVGNVRDVDLTEFWDTNETLEMLRGIRAENDSNCRSCQYLDFCNGCIGNAFISEKRICTYDLYACARQKAYETVGLLR
jgi:radical SAM protein with 4Fe4S-binding SPASM domain